MAAALSNALFTARASPIAALIHSKERVLPGRACSSRESSLTSKQSHHNLKALPSALKRISGPGYSRHLNVTCMSSKGKGFGLPPDKEKVEPPPASKEAAMQRACLALGNALAKCDGKKIVTVTKLKKGKKPEDGGIRGLPRFTIEIPVADDSPKSQATLVLDILRSTPAATSMAPVILLFPQQASIDHARSSASSLGYATNVGTLAAAAETGSEVHQMVKGARLVVVGGARNEDVANLQEVSRAAGSQGAVVVINPLWDVDTADVGSKGFLSSFEALYCFFPLSIQSMFSRTEGAVMRCVLTGSASATPWSIFVKENGEQKCIMQATRRPDSMELQNVSALRAVAVLSLL
eukprot:jgi/Mesvir1/15445/Mv06628-RA.1